jgi:plastocyanin
MLGWKLAALLLSLLVAPAGPPVIQMTANMAFLPKELTVVAGEVVVWRNVSRMPHSVNTIADYCKTDEGKKWVQIPQGAAGFYSGEIQPEEEYRLRFDMPGTYQYLCTFHEDQVMRGTLHVQGSK